jgi:ribonuclease P/MRP protein subunit POP1
MWRPTFQENITDLGVSDGKIIPDVDLCEKSETLECSSSSRHLWVWIHASAFEEGYDNLKLACQKEVHFLLYILIWLSQLYFVSIIWIKMKTRRN